MEVVSISGMSVNLHGAISQKTVFFEIALVQTADETVIVETDTKIESSNCRI
jgi:hypothetical protein